MTFLQVPQSVILPAYESMYTDDGVLEATEAFRKRIEVPLPLTTKLYHGTSLFRFKDQMNDIWFRPSETGNPIVSFSTERMISEYWSDLSAETDAGENPTYLKFCRRIMFEFTIGDILAAGINLYHFSDDVHGIGNCDHEYEICIDKPLHVSAIPYIMHGPNDRASIVAQRVQLG